MVDLIALQSAQDAAVEHAESAIASYGGAVLVGSMGSGKTRTAYRILANHDAKRVLVFSRRTIFEDGVWQREMATVPQTWHYLPLHEGRIVDRSERLRDAFNADHEYLMVGVNYDVLGDNNLTRLLTREWDAVICDESHHIKKPGGTRSLAIKRFAPQRSYSGQAWRAPLAKIRLALTGTPAPNTIEDIYAQFRFAAPEIFGTRFDGFKARYCVYGGYQNRKFLRPQNTEDLGERFSRAAYRIPKSVLGLPGSNENNIDIEFEKNARTIYDQACEGFLRDLGGEDRETPFDIVQLLWAQEITGGWWRDTETGEVFDVSDAKRQRLASALCVDIPHTEPVVVFARFRADLDRIASVAGEGYCEISGRRSDLNAWKDGAGRVLGVQIQAGAEGIDLTRAHNAIYYSKGFSGGDYQQSRARLDRPGQTQSVMYHHLRVSGTIDETVDAVLERKRRDVNQLLGRNVVSLDALLHGRIPTFTQKETLL